MAEHKHEPLLGYRPFPAENQQRQLAGEFLQMARRRRSIRSFCSTAVSEHVIRDCIAAAATAPSGANQQPWHFVAISDPAIKSQIRISAEEEEHQFYNGRAPDEWLQALAPIATDEHKPFLEQAPWLIAVFAVTHSIQAPDSTQQDSTKTAPETQTRKKHYYVSESVGIATGLLITALNHCGLGTLTHTPSPMKFLNKILGRPQNERPFLLLVVGFPSVDCTVPSLTKKSQDEVSTFLK